MKKKLLIPILVLAVILAGFASVSYAAGEWNGPAALLAELTGRDIEDVQAERDSGITYGMQAANAGVQSAFAKGKLEIMQDRLDQAVEDGRITREEADARLKIMEERIASCDGTGQQNCAVGSCRGTGSGIGGRNARVSGNGFGQRQGICQR